MTTPFSLPASEATARDYLAKAKQQNIHDPAQMAAAFGWLTTVLENLLDSLEADHARTARQALKEVA